MITCATHLPARRLLVAAALSLLVPAAPAAAATIATPSPPAGDASAVVVRAKPGARPVVARAPRGTVVLGGPAVVAAVRPPGARAGAVKVRFRGRARVVSRARSLLGGAALPKGACASKGLARVLRRGALTAAGAKALAAALQRQACGAGTAADADVLRRLGLKAPAPEQAAQAAGPAAGATALPGPAPSPPSSRPAPGGPATPPAAGAPPAPAPGSGAADACRNGIDDDGDGQIDALGFSANPDPGCMNGNDPTETGERPVSAACAAVSGVARPGGDATELFAAVNRECGDVVAVTVSAAPGVVSCDVSAAEPGFVCINDKGAAYVYQFLSGGKSADIFDISLHLTGPVDCSKPATIALEMAEIGVDGNARELVAPIEGCAGGGVTPKAECANGVDDDGDGQIDARQQPGATDPDPGCSGTDDTSERGEIAPPMGCDVALGTFGGDPRTPGFIASGCGALTGAWFRAPGTPASCDSLLGGATSGTCAVSGEVGAVTYAASAGELRMATSLAADPQCRNVTVALQRADGQAIEVRRPWC